MIHKSRHPTSKKANFMFKTAVLEELNNSIPQGERSQFVNDALEHAVRRFQMKKAFDAMDEFRNSKQAKHFSTAEILKDIRYGRT